MEHGTWPDLTFYPQLAGGAAWSCIPAEAATPPTIDTWFWAPGLHLEMPGTLDVLDALHAAGWRRIGEWGEDAAAAANLPLLELWGQLGHTRLVRMPGHHGAPQVWAAGADLEHVERVPVALAFTSVAPKLAAQAKIARAPTGQPGRIKTLSIAEVLPPPQIGELGFVRAELDGQRGWRHIPLDTLGEAGAELQQRLAAAIRALAGQIDTWQPITKALASCADPGYRQVKSAFHSRLLATRGKAREDVRVALAELETAQKLYRAMQVARRRYDRETWLARWEEVRQMAQQLAAMYWEAQLADLRAMEHFTPAAAPPASEPTTDRLPASSPQPARRPRAPHIPSGALVIKDPATVDIPSHIFAHGIIRGLLDGSEYRRYEDRSIAEYRKPLAGRNKGEIIITLEPGDGEGWEHVVNSLNALGDEVVDTFCAVLALAIDAHGVENITEPLWVNTDDILRICQRKQSHRAYTPEQRAAVVDHLRTVARAHVRASWPGGRRGREFRIDSAIWDVLGQAIGEYKTVTGEPVWERRQMKVGEWSKLLPPLGRETAIVLRRVLAYHSQRDRYAKRLGRYLTLQFRVNAKHGGRVERLMGVLLEQAGIKPDLKNPGRVRSMIEGALARLKADNVIGEYRLVVDSTPSRQSQWEAAQEQIEQRARGWWELYASQLWQIEPPDYVREQYRHLLREPAAEEDAEGEGT